MNKKPTIVERGPAQSSSLIDLLEVMLSGPQTRALMAEPTIKVVQSRDPLTGRTTYSFRSGDDTSLDESPANLD